MNTKKLQELESLGINTSEALERLGENEELYYKLLNDFISLNVIDDIEKSLREKDALNAFKKSHMLKGVLGNLSINKEYEKCVILVEQLRGGVLDATSELFLELKKTHIEMINNIRRILA